MTATISTSCDVFLSYSASDRHVAAEVAENLAASGLATFRPETVETGIDIGDAIWDALAESRALIAIISPDTPAHAMGMVEIGAATAWNKPVFVLINGPSSTKLPPVLRKYPVYPLGRLEDIVRAIRTGFEPLTDDERHSLVVAYEEVGVSADQLSQSPQALHDLTTKFRKTAHKEFSGERLLSEILRLRKQGHLPRIRTRKLVPE
ncbi:MAG: toll/interleukin-1 receptor domain-containing protein [Planctomycetaceae bacterium]